MLYLAIVAVWAIVLVPMWLRRDTDSSAVSRFRPRRGAETDEVDAPEMPLAAPVPADVPPAPEVVEEPLDVPVPELRRPVTRATVIARRRRRTAGLSLLCLTSVVLTAAGVAPWWSIAPTVLPLAGHLALLRVAVGMDAARHREYLAARARAREAAAEARRIAAEAPEAEIIELVRHDEEEVFDQYAADRRAVGE